jgi:hypothetical protein
MVVREKQLLDPSLDFIKVVVDIERGILASGCELHIDCMDELLTDGSEVQNLWGANVYPVDKSIAYVSMINIRPSAGNRSMEILDTAIRDKIRAVIEQLLF